MTLHFWIGYDDRERDAYEVCVHSLLRHASVPVKVHPLKHRQLRKTKLFWREWRMDGSGQWWDIEDGKPFSTEFSHTRFLVPLLARQRGIDRAYFCDADFLFLDDVAKLDAEIPPGFALSSVKHQFEPTSAVKMDGMVQSRYYRKNWSSLIAFEANDTRLRRLTTECINMADGGWLHQFGWLEDGDVGSIDPRWNALVGHTADWEKGSALHYTNGGPWLDDWCGGPGDALWRDEFNRLKRPTPTTRLKMFEAAE